MSAPRPPRDPRPGLRWSPMRWLLLALPVLLAVAAVLLQAPSGPPPAVGRASYTEAQVLHLPDGPPAAAPVRLPLQPDAALQAAYPALAAALADSPGWQRVALPDTWAQRGRAGPGWALVRVALQLPAAPTAAAAASAVAQAAEPVPLLGLSADRLSTHVALYVNGQLVHDTLRAPLLRRPLPALLALPPALLRPGENRIELLLDNGVRAGLSTLRVDALATLSAERWAGQTPLGITAIALNLASVGTAGFMLLLWLARPGERPLGLFGALGMVSAMRNTSYAAQSWLVSPDFTAWLYSCAYVATVVLLGLFAEAYAGRHLPRWRALLIGVAAVWPLLALVGIATDQAQAMRAVLYPPLLVLAVPAMWLIARQSRGRFGWALTAALVLVLVCGGHDYLYQQGRLPISHDYWIRYAEPVVMALFSGLLLQRLSRALADQQRQNATLEQRVAERTRALQNAHAATNRFLAAASHDLRQPMVSIGLLVGLLQEQAGTPALQRLAARLQESTRAMEGLLKRLLDLSRLEAGTVRLKLEPVALQPLFDAVAAHHGEQAATQGVRLRLRPSARVVHTDAALLEQILRNLVGNAVRYTRSGGVLVGVRRDGPGHVRLAVWDTGPGIPADRQQQVFEEFVRLSPEGGDEAPRHDGLSGLGLGLAIVRRSAELLGCTVQLRSRPGRGTGFSLRLPLAADQPAPATPAPSGTAAPGPVAPGLGLQGCTVWLLEDNDAAREALRLQLQRWGAQVQAVASLAEARGLVAAAGAPGGPGTAPRLLVSDQRLPDGLGTELLPELRQRWPGLPVLLVTGDTAPQDLRVLARWTGSGVAVLHKPFDGETLQAALQPLLNPH